jgi:cytochrome c-type biogenesis protein CcmE
MKPRHKRLAIAGGVLVAVGAVSALVLSAFESNLVFFYSPSQVVAKEVPDGRTFRLGGMVEEGSVRREGVKVNFVVTDTVQKVPVTYEGILPDLFKEGKGVVAQGTVQAGVFQAREVLAKHDENYMPPEAAEALKRAKEGGQMQSSQAGQAVGQTADKSVYKGTQP